MLSSISLTDIEPTECTLGMINMSLGYGGRGQHPWVRGSKGHSPSGVHGAEPLAVVPTMHFLPKTIGDIVVMLESVMSYNHMSNHLFGAETACNHH